MAAYGVPVHFALKALRSMRAATRFAAMGASNVVGCANSAAPSRAGSRLNSAATTRRPVVVQPVLPGHFESESRLSRIEPEGKRVLGGEIDGALASFFQNSLYQSV